jgi:hypothetical protein
MAERVTGVAWTARIYFPEMHGVEMASGCAFESRCRSWRRFWRIRLSRVIRLADRVVSDRGCYSINVIRKVGSGTEEE